MGHTSMVSSVDQDVLTLHLTVIRMGKAKKFIESDDEEIPADDSEDYEEEDEDDDEEERIPIQRQPMKVTARPRRAAAAAVSKLTQKLKDDEDEAEDEDEDEFPEIPKPVLTKYGEIFDRN